MLQLPEVDFDDGVAKECRFLAYHRGLATAFGVSWLHRLSNDGHAALTICLLTCGCCNGQIQTLWNIPHKLYLIGRLFTVGAWAQALGLSKTLSLYP